MPWLSCSMLAKISVAQLSRDLMAILDRVRGRRETFLIQENGKVVAALEPHTEEREATWSSLADALRAMPSSDTAFADDLEDIQRNQPNVPADSWHS